MNYSNPTCHFIPSALTLSCHYDRLWEEQVVLHAGGSSSEPSAESRHQPTVGYWQLPKGVGGKAGSGLAVYDVSIAWYCRLVRRIHSTTPFSLGVRWS